MLLSAKTQITFTRAEAIIIERAICAQMDEIRENIKNGDTPSDYMKAFAACRAILRKLDGIEAP